MPMLNQTIKKNIKIVMPWPWWSLILFQIIDTSILDSQEVNCERRFVISVPSISDLKA